jgi:hypothetical protein
MEMNQLESEQHRNATPKWLTDLRYKVDVVEPEGYLNVLEQRLMELPITERRQRKVKRLLIGAAAAAAVALLLVYHQTAQSGCQNFECLLADTPSTNLAFSLSDNLIEAQLSFANFGTDPLFYEVADQTLVHYLTDMGVSDDAFFTTLMDEF